MKKEDISSAGERLIIDGNAFYELDLNCVHKKSEEKKKAGSVPHTSQEKRQRK